VNLLGIRGVVKAFPGVQALKGVSFNVEEGTVHALVGENGAGKSTLIKVCAGIERKDDGEILWKERPVDIRSPLDARNVGIAVVHQHFPQCSNLTVAQNIYLSELSKTTLRPLTWRGRNQRAGALLRQFGVERRPDDLLGRLSIGERQVVEICKAVAMDVELIIMDEPTSALALQELERFFSLISKLQERGITVVYVSHKLNEVFRIADRITILRDGSEVSTGHISAVTPARVAALMAGHDVQEFERADPVAHDTTEPLLALEDFSVGDRVARVSLSVDPGEILGLAGLQGSGTSALMKGLFGLESDVRGTVRIEGRTAAIHTPKDAIRAGLAYVPADRHVEGLNLIQSLAENTGITILRRLARRGVLKRALIRGLGERAIVMLSIQSHSPWQIVNYLSGGNQQKVVLAKWLVTNPRLLLLDDPTRGVDVGAKAEIHSILRKLVEDGKACVMTSCELPELIAVTNRIITMYNGRITGEFESDTVTQEDIMRAITGATMIDADQESEEGTTEARHDG
jgi:ABC-type sugar transport system ATPase subunit